MHSTDFEYPCFLISDVGTIGYFTKPNYGKLIARPSDGFVSDSAFSEWEEDINWNLVEETASVKLANIILQELASEPSEPTQAYSGTSTEEILEERGRNYGSFNTHSFISQEIKDCIVAGIASNGGREVYEPYMIESLEMIAHKIARIVNGDPRYVDSWQDIAGYAQLVVDHLNRKDT